MFDQSGVSRNPNNGQSVTVSRKKFNPTMAPSRISTTWIAHGR